MSTNAVLLRKSDVVTFFGNMAEVGRAFATTSNNKALSKVAVHAWGDLLPELRARQLLDGYPGLRDFVLDPVTRLTAAEMRQRLSPEAPAQEGQG